MIDHILGRPNTTWKRSQVFLVLFFWLCVLVRGDEGGPRMLWIRRFSRFLQKRCTPWQIIVGTMTWLYAARHFDAIVGLPSPEPLARLYSRPYYRATWINTALETGFATAMSIQPKWLRDIASVCLSGYFIIYANEADERLRRFRAVCTVEMLRTSWEKTNNPYLRFLTYFDRPRIAICRQMTLPRPPSSPHKRPIRAWLFFNGTELELSKSKDLVLDFPGGGFICMSPKNHEERLRRWAIRTGKPVLSIDYGKAPEYPYPWALEEGFDVYQTLVNTKGRAIGMSGERLEMILSGDSAGANIVAAVIFRAQEAPYPIPLPLAVVFNYAALDFSFSAWMSPAHLRVLRAEQSSGHIPGLSEQKDHMAHRSPLAVVKDVRSRSHRRRKSWRDSLSMPFRSPSPGQVPLKPGKGANSLQLSGTPIVERAMTRVLEDGHVADTEEDTDDFLPEAERPIHARVRAEAGKDEDMQRVGTRKVRSKIPIGTRLTMTSRTGHFQDRIISPSMMRAMAILYIGSKHNPDFETDYYISPILAPASLLEKFPPLLMTCGEKDPFVDDTVIFAGRIREAKRARRVTLQTAGLGKAGCVGEGLRMTASVSGRPGEDLSTEAEEDWVQTHIYEGWSHAYLMMTAVMPEARAAINQNADWIRMMFDRNNLKQQLARQHAKQTSPPRRVAPARSKLGEADMGLPITSEESSEEMLEFASSKKRRMSSLSSTRTPMPPPSARHLSGSKRVSSDEMSAVGPITPPLGLPSSPHGKEDQSAADERIGPMPNKRLAALHVPDSALLPDIRVGTPTLIANEAELMRRRRAEAVFGIGESQYPSDAEDDESPLHDSSSQEPF